MRIESPVVTDSLQRASTVHAFSLGGFASAALALLCVLGGTARATVPAPVGAPLSAASRAGRSATDSSSDIVVIGAGIAGLSAALEAARLGASVTIVEVSSVARRGVDRPPAGPPRRGGGRGTFDSVYGVERSERRTNPAAFRCFERQLHPVPRHPGTRRYCTPGILALRTLAPARPARHGRLPVLPPRAGAVRQSDAPDRSAPAGRRLRAMPWTAAAERAAPTSVSTWGGTRHSSMATT
jgi:hypothetical protein